MTERPAPSAVQRRLNAINALVTDVLGPGWGGQVTDRDRERVAGMIEALAPLGLTDRWREAVATWAVVVRERQDATHALTQWAIFAGHAAL